MNTDELSSPTASQTGFDAPVSDPAKDALYRASFSRRVYGLLCPRNAPYSVRVGLTGDWGSGKTTVAAWIEHYATVDGHKVIWYNPWSVTSIDSLWFSFHNALRDGLKLSLPKGNTDRKRWAWADFKSLIGLNTETIEAIGQVNGILGGLAALTLEHVKIKPHEIKKLREEIGDNTRIIVIIDDLDRADPALLPKLLLSLRELLDYPGFSFLVPFDINVVSDALTAHHPAWKTGDQFLEKILDYRLELPEVTKDARVSLFEDALSRVAPSFRSDRVRDALEWLPSNPRRIKSLARTFQPINSELSRHKADEIDWRSLLYAAILKTENERLLETFTDKILDSQTNVLALWVGDEETRRKTQERSIDEAIGSADVSAGARKHLKEVCIAWSSEISFSWVTRARYVVRLADSPENLTWKEFEETLELWRSKQKIGAVLRHLTNRAQSEGRRETDVVDEMLNALTERYNIDLEAASSAFLLSENEARISEAASVADLVEAFSRDDLDANAHRGLFNRFLTVARKWAHFATNPADARIRDREIQILTGMLNAAGEDWIHYAQAIFDLQDIQVQGQEILEAKLRPLLSKFDDRAVAAVIDIMRVREEVRTLMGGEHIDALKAVLLDVNGPAWTPSGSSPMETLLKEAASDAGIQVNARVILEHVAAGRLPRPSDGSLGATFTSNHRVIGALWAAAVAQRVQYRMLSSIADLHSALIKQGVPGATLPLPNWLTATVKTQTPAAPSADQSGSLTNEGITS